MVTQIKVGKFVSTEGKKLIYLIWTWCIFTDVTILLSLTVFLNTVSESMPNTSDAVPLISTSPIVVQSNKENCQLNFFCFYREQKITVT
jgi:hypothetical protein